MVAWGMGWEEGQEGGVTNTKGHKEIWRDDGHVHYLLW